MLTQRSCLRMLLVAAVLSPAWTFDAPTASAARKSSHASVDFQCLGVGRGGHKKNMTEAECRKAGGTVERDSAPASMPAPVSRKHSSGGEEPRRVSAPQGESFSCRGIGSGHHYRGMTKEDCVRKGGTVEDAKPRR